jgi:uncharacterized YigZ family protein
MPTRTIARAGSSELIVKKSRFIADAERVASEEEARAFVARIRGRSWDASHHCTAWIIGERGEYQRSNDDGEPAGSAGLPMLTVLQRRGLTDTAVVVTRYFGGTLLGVGGLIRAYGQAVSDLIDQVGIVERQPRTILAVSVDYEEAGRLESALRGSTFQLGDVEYGAEVTFQVKLAPDEVPAFEGWLSHATGGRRRAEVAGTEVVEIPVKDPFS